MADRNSFVEKNMKVFNFADRVLFPRAFRTSAGEVYKDWKDNKLKCVGKVLAKQACQVVYLGMIVASGVGLGAGVSLGVVAGLGAVAGARYIAKSNIKSCLDIEYGKGNKGNCGLSSDELSRLNYHPPVITALKEHAPYLLENTENNIRTLDRDKKRKLQGLGSKPEQKQVSSDKRTTEVNQNLPVMQRRVKNDSYR